MKKKNKETTSSTTIDEMPSKGKIIGAWILLVILISCVAGLIYLKKNTELEEEKVTETENKISPIITTELTNIVNYFNANSLISEYEQEGLTLTASLQDATIIISYATSNTNGIINYNYNQISANLNTTFEQESKELNDKIFKVLVMACRERKSWKEDITNEVENFLTSNTEIIGLNKETNENNITYHINVTTPGPEPAIITSNTSTPQNDTTESAPINQENTEINE